MKTLKVEKEFVNYIRELVSISLEHPWLDECASVAASELSFWVIEEVDESFTESTVFDFMQRYPIAVLATVDWVSFTFGNDAVPRMFEDWVTVANHVIAFGIENMVDELPLVIERLEDDEPIEFDSDTVQTLVGQLATTDFKY